MLLFLANLLPSFISHTQVEGIALSKVNTSGILGFEVSPVEAIDCAKQNYLFNLKTSSTLLNNNEACSEPFVNSKGEVLLSAKYIKYINQKSITYKVVNQDLNSLKQQYLNNFWQTHKGVVGIPTGDGRFFTDLNYSGGGVVLLGPNFKEKKKDFGIVVTDLKGNKTNATLLKNVYEFTKLSFLPDTRRQDLWFTVIPSDVSCIDSKLSNTTDCSASLNYLDFKTNKVYKVSTVESSLNPKISSRPVLRPILATPKTVVMYFSYGATNQLIIYNVENKTQKTIILSGALSYNFNPGRQDEMDRIADYDNLGNIYLTQSINNSTVKLLKITPNGNQSTYDFDFKNNSASDIQIAIDRDNNRLFAVNLTWDGNDFTVLDIFDLTSGALLEANQITKQNEDLRGIVIKNGIFIGGFSKSLGLYNFNNKSWKYVAQANGLIEDKIRDVKQLDVNTICVSHEIKGVSCTGLNLKDYFQLLSTEKVGAGNLNPTPTGSPFEISYAPITNATNWRARNDEFYSIEYPSSLNLLEVSHDNGNNTITKSIIITDYKTYNELKSGVLSYNSAKHPQFSCQFDPYHNEPSIDSLTFEGPNTLYGKNTLFSINGYKGVLLNGNVNNEVYQNTYLRNPKGGVLSCQSQNIDKDTLNIIISSVKFADKIAASTPTPTLYPGSVVNGSTVTYTDSRYGYSFSFPKQGATTVLGKQVNLSYHVEISNNNLSLLGVDTNADENYIIEYFEVVPNPSDTVAQKYDQIAGMKTGDSFGDNLQQNQYGTSYVKQNNVSLGGMNAYSINAKTYAESTQYLLFKRNNILFEITGNYGSNAGTNIPTSQSVYNSVTSTFKFVK